MTYFDRLKTVEEIKTHYMKLLKQGGLGLELDTEYVAALKACDRQVAKDSYNNSHTYFFNEKTERQIMDVIASLLALNMQEVTIALIGTWVWVRGNTKPYSDKLGKKGLCFRYSGEKAAWYFHLGYYKRKAASGGNFQGMAAKYGYEEFKVA